MPLNIFYLIFYQKKQNTKEIKAYNRMYKNRQTRNFAYTGIILG